MNIIDLLKNALDSLMSNKFRTFLTTLGILIGVGSVVTLLNVGRSAQGSIEDQFNSFGANNIYIIPGEDTATRSGPPSMLVNFTDRQVERFLDYQFNYVKYKASYNQGFYLTEYNGKSEALEVLGFGGDYPQAMQIEVKKGMLFNEGDNAQRNKVAIIGPKLVTDLFNDKNPLGEEIKIKGDKFKVIGISKEKSGSSFDDPNKAIIVPLNTFNTYLSKSEGASFFVAQAKDKKFIEQAKNEVKTTLARIRNIKKGDNNDFSVRDAGEILNNINTVTGIFTIFLAAVGSISLLVGGIGVMNIMFVSITERTKEIGLRKSLGAKNRDILYQFLSESMVVSMLGGIMGIMLGVFLSLLINNYAGLGSRIYPNTIILAIIFSLTIGLIFGIYPASKASKLNPIDALRYE